LGGIIKSRQELPVTGVVLAGGKGLRLGRPKALERVGGVSLLGRVISCIQPLCFETIVVTREDQLRPLSLAGLQVTIATDLIPERGPLGGLFTGLTLAKTDYCLVVACDMPFLNPALLTHLLGLAPEADIVAPVMKGMTEQLHTVYTRKTCLAAIEQLLAMGQSRVSSLFEIVKVRFVTEPEMQRFDPELLSFFNVNTEADFRQAETMSAWKQLACDREPLQ